MNGVNSTPQTARAEAPPRPVSSLAQNGIVFVSMLLVAAAAGVAVHVHAGIDEHLAIVFTGGMFCVLLAAHLLIMGPASAASTRRAPTARMTAPAHDHRAEPSPAPAPTPAPARAASPPPIARPAAPPAPAVAAKPQQPPAIKATETCSTDLPPDFPDKLAAALGVTGEHEAPAARVEPGLTAPPPPAAATSRPVAEHRKRLMELSEYRPARAVEPVLTPAATQRAAPDARATNPPPNPASDLDPALPPLPDTPRADLDPGPALPIGPADPALAASPPPQNIEGILKRMAAQIRAGGEASDGAASEEAAPAEEPRHQEPAPVTAPSSDEMTAPPAGDPRKAISAAVNALKAAADDMRAKVQDEEPAASPPIHARLAEVAEAVSKDKLDIYLDPIMGLGDGRPRHFEVSVLARTASGDTFDPEDFRALTRGSGLMPLLDSSRLRHSSAIAERLAARVKNAAVFSVVEGETLDNRRFFATVDHDQTTGHLQPQRLVLSLRQADVRTFVPAHFESLKLLRDMGFRFALQDVTELDMSFDTLSGIGFQFAKLDAEVFLDGLRVGAETLPAAEICRHLQAMGLTIIIGAIASEEQRAAIAASGVVLGQGLLFGAPSPIRRAVVDGAEAAA